MYQLKILTDMPVRSGEIGHWKEVTITMADEELETLTIPLEIAKAMAEALSDKTMAADALVTLERNGANVGTWVMEQLRGYGS